MSFADTVVLFVLALLLFGPKKLPVIAKQIGKALNEFKSQIEAEISQLEYEERRKKYEEERKILPSAPPAGTVSSAEPELPPPPQEGGPAATSVNTAHDTTNA